MAAALRRTNSLPRNFTVRPSTTALRRSRSTTSSVATDPRRPTPPLSPVSETALYGAKDIAVLSPRNSFHRSRSTSTSTSTSTSLPPFAHHWYPTLPLDPIPERETVALSPSSERSATATTPEAEAANSRTCTDSDDDDDGPAYTIRSPPSLQSQHWLRTEEDEGKEGQKREEDGGFAGMKAWRKKAMRKLLGKKGPAKCTRAKERFPLD